MLAVLATFFLDPDLSQLTITLKPPSSTLRAGTEVELPVIFANKTDHDVTWSPSDIVTAYVDAGVEPPTVPLRYSGGSRTAQVIAAGRSIEAPYTFLVPTTWHDRIRIRADRGRRSTIVVQALPTDAAVAGEAIKRVDETRTTSSAFGQMRLPTPHEPNYFLLGDQPGARFQFSIKYQLFSDSNSWLDDAPDLGHLYIGYTQISLWDIFEESGPFVDSSYKPVFFWQRERISRVPWIDADWGGEIGVQHESNGKSGDDSRSLNVVYFKPALLLNPDGSSRFTFAPRVNIPLGESDENSDLERYRGYVDYHLIYEHDNDLQIALLGRLGTSGKGSLQADLTYPMNQMAGWLPDLFLQVQYFTGYGESLLGYNEDAGDQLRIGFAISRW